MLQEAIDQAKALVTSLEVIQAQLETVGDEQATTPPEPPPVVDPAPPADGPDNSLPFKCPACGATYAAQVICTNGHPPEQTLPTAEVLAGAEPAGPPEAPPVVEAPSQSVIEQGADPAPPADVPPAWPTQ